ncbi:MAG TPA: PilZ domain-containing protein [Candidatus Binatus sp.]|nr:PilZ domain-containing protein [Candidatus Binatus sp.]
MVPTNESIGPRGYERRVLPRYHLQKRLDILLQKRVGVSVVGSGESYWGRINNLSRTGIMITVGQHLKASQRVVLRFSFKGFDQEEVIEDLVAKVVWKTGDSAGLAFDPPLTPGSHALQEAPCLVAHLVEHE